MPWNRSLLRRRLSLAALLSAGCLAVSAAPAGAATGTVTYNGAAAATYADAYALNADTPTYPYLDSDCTNFVSQAVYNGGYPFVNDGGSGTDTWWFHNNGQAKNQEWLYDYSPSWVAVQDFYNFMMADSPGGTPEGTASGSSEAATTPLTMISGDLLSYDWGQGEGMSHFAMQTGLGVDPNSGWVGNYVDYHTTNRYHAFWSLKPYNAYWSTTTVYFTHVNSSAIIASPKKLYALNRGASQNA